MREAITSCEATPQSHCTGLGLQEKTYLFNDCLEILGRTKSNRQLVEYDSEEGGRVVGKNLDGDATHCRTGGRKRKQIHMCEGVHE